MGVSTHTHKYIFVCKGSDGEIEGKKDETEQEEMNSRRNRKRIQERERGKAKREDNYKGIVFLTHSINFN